MAARRGEQSLLEPPGWRWGVWGELVSRGGSLFRRENTGGFSRIAPCLPHRAKIPERFPGVSDKFPVARSREFARANPEDKVDRVQYRTVRKRDPSSNPPNHRRQLYP